MSDPTAIILMPVFNTAPYVAAAIQSVLDQTHRDFELRIIDDGSTDGTLEICRQFQKQDPRVKVSSHPNMGIGNTMNAAFESIDTAWVFCMHGDDLMLPQRIEQQLAFIHQNPDLAAISSRVCMIDQNGREIGRPKSWLTQRDSVARGVAAGQCVAFNHSAAAFRPDIVKAVGGYRQEFWPAEDTELWNRLIFHGHAILVQDQCLLKYRIHHHSASMRQAKLMVQKLDWVTCCMARRRDGQSEPGWEEFQAQQATRPWPLKWNSRRKQTARILYQSAQSNLAGRRYPRFISTLATAALLEPSLVLPRVLSRITKRANSR